MSDVRDSWDAKAEEWDRHVGEHGDANRRMNSDPVLWRFLGGVDGLRVLDAGCGTGYLSVQLARRGADVVGVDPSEEMLRVARRNADRAGVSVDLHADDAQSLGTIADASVDRIVSNYVLMDLPDHEAAQRSFRRVLRPGGVAVVVFLHPCFDVPAGPERIAGPAVRYTWPWPYIERRRFTSSWGPFATEFIGFHRSLSDYWRAIRAAGLLVDDFDEPVVAPDREDVDPAAILRARWTPFSVAFRLVCP
jgi:ubiquinone/menaquinone biosynthesis C-methylase UbiE